MSKRHDNRQACAYCGEPVAQCSHDCFSYTIDSSDGARVEFFWHLNCTDEHERYQDLVNVDVEDNQESAEWADRYRAAYRELVLDIQKRLGEKARRAIKIRRDMRGTGTLRNPLNWGLVSRRAA